MIISASAPVATHIPDHVIEEIAALDLELLTVKIHINKLRAKQDWLTLLRENFLRRFYDGC